MDFWQSEIIFLGAFAKLRKAVITFLTSVRLCFRLAARNNSASTGQFSMEFDIGL